MKKWLCAILTLMMLGGMALAEGAVQLDETLTYTLDASTNTLSLELAENPTTGFSWTFTVSQEGLLQAAKDEFQAADAQQDRVGVGGKRLLAWTKAENAPDGELTLSLVYSQPWEGVPALGYDMTLAITGGALSVVDVQPLETSAVAYELAEDGSSLMIVLDSNPTTGYTWSYKASAEGLLTETSNSYEPFEEEEGLVGGGGAQLYVFEPAKGASGTVTLTFTEGRSWETEVLQTYEMDIAFGPEGAMTVTRMEKVEK